MNTSEVSTNEFKSLLVDHLRLHFVAYKSSQQYRELIERKSFAAKITDYKRRLIALDENEALRLFSAYQDEEGLALICKTARTSEMVRRDADDYLHPSEEINPACTGHYKIKRKTRRHSSAIHPIQEPSPLFDYIVRTMEEFPEQ